MRSPPARSRIAGSPRLGVGTLPAVPAKKSERSMRSARLASLHPLDRETGEFEPRVAGRVLVARRRAQVSGAIDFDDASGVAPVEIDLELRVHPHEPLLVGRQRREAGVLFGAARPGPAPP